MSSFIVNEKSRGALPHTPPKELRPSGFSIIKNNQGFKRGEAPFALGEPPEAK